jgi:hypothetical protein
MSAVLICVLVYVVVALVALRPLAGHYAYRLGRGGDPDWLQGSALAALTLVVWPVALVPWALFSVSGRLKIGAERAALEQQGRVQQREHVTALERELGLGDGPSDGEPRPGPVE